MSTDFSLKKHDIDVTNIVRNARPAQLYKEAMLYEADAAIADSGAIMVRSGEKTGRSPLDKRIVKHPASQDNIWWGSVNVPISESIFEINRERAVDYGMLVGTLSSE